MPLILEIRDPFRKAWLAIGTVLPGHDGSISHNPDNRTREVYRFRCLGDHSLLERSTGGADAELGPLRAITTLGFTEVARLSAAEPIIEMWLKTDRMAEPRRIRFRHSD